MASPILSPGISRSKHIDVLHHFTRERVARREVNFTYVQSSDQLADIMTKPLPSSKFKYCCDGIGLIIVKRIKETKKKRLLRPSLRGLRKYGCLRT